MHKITAVPFKRMMLVDEMMLQKLKEDAITGYNAAAKTMVQHKDAMDSALVAANGGPVADDRRLALYLANEQRFQQLLRNATANATDRKAVTSSSMPSQMVQTEPTETATQGVQVGTEMGTQATDTEEAAASALKSDTNLARQFKIPEQYDRKFEALVSTMAAHPDIISVSEDNELVVGKKVVRGTSFADLMRSLFVDSSSPAAGLGNMVSALNHIGVTEDMLSAKRAKEALRHIGVTVAKGKTESSSAETKVAKVSKKETDTAQSGTGKRKMTHQLPPGNHVRVLKLYK